MLSLSLVSTTIHYIISCKIRKKNKHKIVGNLKTIHHSTCNEENEILNMPDVDYVHINQNNYDQKISPRAIINNIYCTFSLHKLTSRAT